MPSIRHLTPADYADMCDILDQHSSGPGAYANDRNATPSPDFHRHSKWYIDYLWDKQMANFFGYFNDEGQLAAFICFVRWLNATDVTINIRVENPSLDLPRAEGTRWSDAANDLVNWGVGYFWSEGIKTFWSLQIKGQEEAGFTAHPNCLLNQYQREKVMNLSAGELPPEALRRVQWMPIFQESAIYKYTDPLPLAEYLKVDNDPTGDAG